MQRGCLDKQRDDGLVARHETMEDAWALHGLETSPGDTELDRLRNPGIDTVIVGEGSGVDDRDLDDLRTSSADGVGPLSGGTDSLDLERGVDSKKVRRDRHNGDGEDV